MLSQPTIGKIEALIAAVLDTAMLYFIKSSTHTVSQLTTIRAMTNFVMSYWHAKLTGEDLFGSWENVGNCVSRGVITVLSIGLSMYSNKILPLTFSPIISRLNVFGVFVFSIFYLGHRFETKMFLLMLTSFFGISLIACPSIYGIGSAPDGRGLQLRWTSEELLALASAIVSMLLGSFNRVFVAQISSKVGRCQSVMMMSVVMGPLYDFFLFSQPLEFRHQELSTYIGYALCSYFFQYLFMDANKRGIDPNVGVMINSSIIFFTMVVDFYLFGTQLSLTNLIGAVIVAGSIILSLIK